MPGSERESSVENYLVKRVAEIGGETRKLKWIGRRGAMDRLVLYRGAHFVELKRPKGGKLSAQQATEYETFTRLNVSIHIVNTKAKVDEFIDWLIGGWK